MRKWNNKKIAYVSILIAASVVFVIIGSKLFAITTFPSFKVAFGGLPVKITGFLFGPLIGAITGVVADLLSFALMPTYYHPIYTFIMAMSGFIPGIVWFFMMKKERSVNTHFFITLIFLLMCAIGLFLGIQYIPESTLVAAKTPIKTRWMLQLLACGGILILIIVHVILRILKYFKKDAGLFKIVAPIVLFTVFLEIHNSLMTPLADSQALGGSYGAFYVGHLLTSPIKLLSNVTIITITYKIVSPLIKGKLLNTYDAQGGSMKRNIYVCGPTVYNNPHIGNLRPIITFDIYIRALRAKGVRINFIHNITDIDDKIIKKAIEEGVTEKEISERYTEVYYDLLDRSNIKTPSEMPLVTKNLKGIIRFIRSLEEKGFAYEVDGNVYFDVTSQSSYGSVSNRALDEMRFEETIGKKHPGDFALWKKTKEGIQFDSPWGKGRPGWHTECAYFAKKYSGKTLDMHGGGVDLLFPHHENENAQFKALTNQIIASEWKHMGHINFDGSKMSKSLGNVMDAQDFFNKNNPAVLRLLFLTTNPTAPINLTEKMIESVSKKYNQFAKAFAKAQLVAKVDIKNETVSEEIISWEFAKVMEILNSNLKAFNSGKKEVAKELLANLSLLGFITKDDIVSKKTISKYKKWEKAREDKNFLLADKIREELKNTKLI